MRLAALACSLVSLTGLAACPDRSLSEVNPIQDRVETKDLPIKINRDIDILFVIDDSPSMADKQNNLAQNFPRFIEVLSRIEGGLPNVHISVVTSDFGTRGTTNTANGIGRINEGGCDAAGGDRGEMQTFGAAVNGRFISDIQPADPNQARIRNYDGDLADVFGQMARGAGAGGCGFEQHLSAMRAALQPTNVVNEGFLRPDAFLAVIFIADEDDCSLSDARTLLSGDPGLGRLDSFRCTRFGVICDQNGINSEQMNALGTKAQCHPSEASPYLAGIREYVDFLKGLKQDPRKVIVAGIMGTIDPENPVITELRAPEDEPTNAVPALARSCRYSYEEGGVPHEEVADPPIRLKFFLDQFPDRNTFASICQRDLSGGLQQIADLLKAVIGDPCIDGKLADTDKSTPEPDYECAVSTVINIGQSNQDETTMPRCTPESDAATNKPCWHIVTDPERCTGSEDSLALKIEGEEELKARSEEIHILANCVTEVIDASTN